MSMKLNLVTGMAAFLWLAAVVAAQEPVKAPEAANITPLKIQVVLSEYEGETKVSSLPYFLLANAEPGRRAETSLRMGLRVPIAQTVTPQGGITAGFQYHDVGTDVDCQLTDLGQGRFRLTLNLRRSSILSPPPPPPPPSKSSGVPGGVPGGVVGGEASRSRSDARSQQEWVIEDRPIIRNFGGKFDLLLRDGQTVQSTLATDPVSGRVVKVDVTLTVLK